MLCQLSYAGILLRRISSTQQKDNIRAAPAIRKSGVSNPFPQPGLGARTSTHRKDTAAPREHGPRVRARPPIKDSVKKRTRPVWTGGKDGANHPGMENQSKADWRVADPAPPKPMTRTTHASDGIHSAVGLEPTISTVRALSAVGALVPTCIQIPHTYLTIRPHPSTTSGIYIYIWKPNASAVPRLTHDGRKGITSGLPRRRVHTARSPSPRNEKSRPEAACWLLRLGLNQRPSD